jgi:hypothetical protein
LLLGAVPGHIFGELLLARQTGNTTGTQSTPKAEKSQAVDSIQPADQAANQEEAKPDAEAAPEPSASKPAADDIEPEKKEGPEPEAEREPGPTSQAEPEAPPGPPSEVETAEEGPEEEASENVPTDETAASVEASEGRAKGPREILALMGLDESHFERLRDGEPWQEGENELLLRLLFRMPSFRASDIHRWTREMPGMAAFEEAPDERRGEFFALRGTVLSVEPQRPLPEVAERFQFDVYYRCRLQLADGQGAAVVFTRIVPEAWTEGGPVDERGGANGLFLKVGGAEEEPGTAFFAAPRLAWYPDTLLGQLGMDYGLFEDVKDRRSLTRRERDAFYRMLTVVGFTDPTELMRLATERAKQATGEKAHSVVPLFNKAPQQRGKLFVLEGTARRVVEVRVEDPDIIQRFGVDHYYEMAVYTDDSQGNPIFFCVRRLPEGMPLGDGPRYGEFVRVAGFFFKTWGYRPIAEGLGAGAQEEEAVVRRQLAPLLIGNQPVWIPTASPEQSPWVGTVAGGLFVLALVGIWIGVWRYSRGDKEFHEQTILKTLQLDQDVQLDQLGLEASDGPDFTHLAEADTAEASEAAGRGEAEQRDRASEDAGPASDGGEPPRQTEGAAADRAREGGEQSEGDPDEGAGREPPR